MGNRMNRTAVGLGLAVALLLAGCGNDDGAGVRNVDGTQASGSGTGSGSGTASGSGAASGSGTASGQAAACKPVGDAGSSDATIAVGLKEWSVLPARADVPPGTVTFHAHK